MTCPAAQICENRIKYIDLTHIDNISIIMFAYRGLGAFGTSERRNFEAFGTSELAPATVALRTGFQASAPLELRNVETSEPSGLRSLHLQQ